MKPHFAHVIVVLLSTFLVACCSAFLSWDDSGNLIAHSYSVWGDWSAHLTFIENFRHRGLSWILGESPLFAGVPFQYPFLSHWVTATFAQLFGLRSITAIETLSLLLLFLAPVFVYRLFRHFGNSPLGTAISVVVFFLFGGFQWMHTESLKATEPWSNQFDQASVFTQFVGFEFYPQRAFLFGLCMLCLGLDWALSPGGRTKKRIAVVILGLLALTHIHSFIAVAAALGFAFLFRRNFPTFRFSAAVALLGLAGLGLLLLRQFPPEFKHSWQIWLPGWALNSSAGVANAAEMNPLSFWVWNTGLWVPVAMLSWIATFRSRSSQKPWVHVAFFSGLSLFVLGNLWSIQPYWYDNLKVFTYAFFFWAPFWGWAWDQVSKKGCLFRTVIAVVIFAQTVTAIHDLRFLQAKNQQATFFMAHEFALSDQLVEKRISPTDLAVIAPRHNHWVPALSGQSVWMGFPGWLWSWGIQYGQREKDLNEILLGGPRAIDLIQQNQIKWIILNVNDRVGNTPVNLEFFRRYYLPVIQRDGWEVFATQKSATKS